MAPGAARRGLAALGLALLVATPGAAQQVLLDGRTRVEGLWCFQSAVNPSEWYYVPQTARLATDENGDPVFSFLRYVVNRAAADGASSGITTAEGGGIVTLVATYDTPPEVVQRAARALQRKVQDDEVVLKGPLIFKQGRYMLVSSILRGQGGSAEKEEHLLATGNAPVFEGNEVAFSFDVSPEKSKLLLESFQMATPDISIVFDMTFEALTPSYDALLEVDWDEVSKNETMGGGASVGYGQFRVGAEIEKGLKELHSSQAIRITTRGSNPNMEGLLEKVNAKLLDLMFKKVEPAPEKPEEEKDILESLTALGESYYELAAPNYLSVSFKYERRQIKTTGKTVFHLTSQSPVDQNSMMAANIGALYERYKDDANRFRTVNLSDAAFQQREIHVGIDGAILPEFEKYVNSVTVTLRKVHQNGAQTLREVVIDRNTFAKEKRDFRMVYGWNGDEDRAKWLEYEYRTRWSFKGGGLHETDWTKTDINMIDLYAPYVRNTVQLVGDAEALREQGVRAIAVHVEYDFFDGRRSQDLALQTSEPIDGREIEITLPLSVYDYDYSVTWMRKGAPPLEVEGTDDTGVIFVDELPPAATAGG